MRKPRHDPQEVEAIKDGLEELVELHSFEVVSYTWNRLQRDLKDKRKLVARKREIEKQLESINKRLGK